MRRRWLPWRRRVRELPWGPDTGVGDVPVVNVVVLLLMIPLVVVLAALLVELLVLLVLLPLYLLARILLRTPWVVEVTELGAVCHQEPVPGWGASGAVRDGIAQRLRAGMPVEDVAAERVAIGAGSAPRWLLR